jgi:iron complex outermembrane receptor protein
MGGNVLARYEHDFADYGDLMVRFYYDRSQREDRFDVLWGEVRDTWNLEFQHAIALPAAVQLTWGGQYWRTNEEITPGFETTYVPPVFEEDVFTGFLQLESSLLDDRLRLLLGSKFIDNDHTGFEYQPSFRFSVSPVPEDSDWGRHTLWGAVTRAVRLPSRSSDDIRVVPPGFPTPVLVGNRSTISEIVYAFEGGYRVEPVETVQLDVAGYYNLYRDILSLEQSPPPAPLGLPLTWSNWIEGDGYGIEVSASWRPLDWWKLRVGYTWAQLDLRALPQSNPPAAQVGIGTPAISGAVPEHQVQLVSTMDLPWDFEFDTHLYYVDDVPLFLIGDYVRLDLRLGWRPLDWLELYVTGMNLIDDRHQEWAYEFEFTETLVPRSFMAGATLRF